MLTSPVRTSGEKMLLAFMALSDALEDWHFDSNCSYVNYHQPLII